MKNLQSVDAWDLCVSDPSPVELINAEADDSVLLICEHAGQEIPQSLGQLGLTDEQRQLHISYDIGAEKVARLLADRLKCSLVVQRYSRLVYDCNRPSTSAMAVPEVSDHVQIPGNLNLTNADRGRRKELIFDPFAECCQRETNRAKVNFTFSIHSFTDEMDGEQRPWDIGFLYRTEESCGSEIVSLSRAMWPDLTIGDKLPYGINDDSDWFIPVCAEPRAIPHCLVEIRNDHLRTNSDCALWADRLFQLILKFKEQSDAAHP